MKQERKTHKSHKHTSKNDSNQNIFVAVKPVDSKQAWICETLCDFFLHRSIPKTEAEHLIKLSPGRRGHIDLTQRYQEWEQKTEIV